MTDHVLSDRANGVLTLTLNRPDKKNALTQAMYQTLGDAIDGAAAAADVRCILIQAEGDVFTAGNDLGDFAAINRREPSDAPRAGGNPLLAALACRRPDRRGGERPRGGHRHHDAAPLRSGIRVG